MSVWRCRRCEYTADELWEGRCPQCCGFYRVIKVGTDTKEQKNRSTFAKAEESKVEYIATGFEGFDQVLGGGLVAGCSILFGGFRGAGKSTLLAQVADAMAHRRKVVYASSEQGVKGMEQIAHRVGARSDNVIVLGDQKEIEETLKVVKLERAFLAVYDSLQKFVSCTSSGMMGSAAQGDAVAGAIKAYHREANTCAIVVNQMSRSGEIKGGTGPEHDLDTVMVLAFPDGKEEDLPDEENIRKLIVDKNRNGSEDRASFWRMTPDGRMELVPKKSKLLEFPRRGKYRKED